MRQLGAIQEEAEVAKPSLPVFHKLDRPRRPESTNKKEQKLRRVKEYTTG